MALLGTGRPWVQVSPLSLDQHWAFVHKAGDLAVQDGCRSASCRIPVPGSRRGALALKDPWQKCHKFLLRYTGLNLVTWPHLTREPREYNRYSRQDDARLRAEVVLLWKEERWAAVSHLQGLPPGAHR